MIERETRGDVAIHDKDLVRVTAKDLISEMVQTASSSKGLIFSQVSDGVSQGVINKTYLKWRW